MKPLLEVKDLCVYFSTLQGEVKAVDGVSLTLGRGEILGIVGESGSGKSITALALMGLVPKPEGYLAGGDILLEGSSIASLPEQGWSKIRGKRMAMIFQEPMTSLNPVFPVGDQIIEALEIHERMSRKEMHQRMLSILSLVRIPDPGKVAACYPHQLSGGMRQRVMIAMALVCNPDILIADEPTTALDVTIQAQILDLLQDLVRRLGIGILFITHDLGVISEMANHISVLYCGKIVEQGEASQVLFRPYHPYTKGLIRARPANYNKDTGYYTIQGMVPSLQNMPQGCAFAPRCLQAISLCHQELPPLQELSGQKVRCWLYAVSGKEVYHGKNFAGSP